MSVLYLEGATSTMMADDRDERAVRRALDGLILSGNATCRAH